MFEWGGKEEENEWERKNKQWAKSERERRKIVNGNEDPEGGRKERGSSVTLRERDGERTSLN